MVSARGRGGVWRILLEEVVVWIWGLALLWCRVWVVLFERLFWVACWWVWALKVRVRVVMNWS